MCAAAAVVAVRERLVVDALRYRNMRTFYRVVFSEVLADDLVALGEEGNIDLHKLVVLCDALVRLVYYVVALEAVVPLFPYPDVRNSREGNLGRNIRKIGLVSHA